MRKLAPYFLTAAILFCAVLFYTVPALLRPDDISFDSEAACSLNDGWQWTDSAGTAHEVSLPATLPAAAGETVSLSLTLPDALQPGASLCIRTSLQNIRILVDGQELYSRGLDSSTYLGKVFGSSWNLVRLPGDAAGKTLTLELTSPYARSSGVVNSVSYGSRSALLFQIVRQHLPSLLIAAALLLIGLIILAGHFVLHEKRYNNSILLYLGFFILLSSCWMAGESKMLQFFSGNSFLITNLPYFALMLVPLPYGLYMDQLLGTGRHRGFLLLSWLYAANFCLSTLLILFQVIDFYQTVLWTDGMIGLGVLYSLVCTFYEAVASRSRGARIQLGAVLVLLFFVVAELFNFMFSSLLTISDYLRVGILLFVAINGITSVQKIESFNEADKEKAYLQKLAYTDLLTGGANRTAFYRDLEQLLAREDILTVAQLDVNGLKFINDHYGHAAGDEAIRDTYSCIQSAFGPLGTCYRMGGDEFLCLIPGEDAGKMQAAEQQFQELVRQRGKERDYPFSVAYGASVYRRGEADFQKIMEMYEDKRSSRFSRENAAPDGPWAGEKTEL